MHAREGFDRLSPNGGRPATAERPGLPGRRLAHADIAHARTGFDRLSPNGCIATVERTGLPARSLALAKTAHAREGFDKLSLNGEVRKGFDRLSPNGEGASSEHAHGPSRSERAGLPARSLASTAAAQRERPTTPAPAPRSP
jgi:hypothetical protein